MRVLKIVRGLLAITSYRCAKSAIERFALKWIQEHITAFGGDPERVTMYASSTCSESGVWSNLELRAFFIVGARVQVPCPLVFTLSQMMETLRVSFTERSWYESLFLFRLGKSKFFRPIAIRFSPFSARHHSSTTLVRSTCR